MSHLWEPNLTRALGHWSNKKEHGELYPGTPSVHISSSRPSQMGVLCWKWTGKWNTLCWGFKENRCRERWSCCRIYSNWKGQSQHHSNNLPKLSRDMKMENPVKRSLVRLKIAFMEKIMPVFMSCTYPNKWPQTWLNTTEVYSLEVLETRSLKSRDWKGHISSIGSGDEAFPVTLRSGSSSVSWLVAA